MPELKKISRATIPAALDKAVRYRLLNEPMQAESICRDVLAVDDGNQQALINLLLALTDQFSQRLARASAEAWKIVERLEDRYHKAYYSGIICERRALAHLERGSPGSGNLAYDWLAQALDWFEKAEALAPPESDDAILRWNACQRIIERHPEVRPAPADSFQPMLE